MIQVNRIYLIFNRLVTKKFLVDTSDFKIINKTAISWYGSNRMVADMYCLSYCPTLIGQ